VEGDHILKILPYLKHVVIIVEEDRLGGGHPAGHVDDVK
jgi:hypothetical protein